VVTHETPTHVLGPGGEVPGLAQNVGDLSSPAQVLRTRTRQYNAVGELIRADSMRTCIPPSYAYDGQDNRVGTRNARARCFLDTFDATATCSRTPAAR